MTSQGRAYSQLQRALRTGNAFLALEAARHLRAVGLADALSICLLLREGDPVRYDRAATRWLARYAAMDRDLCLADAGELVELLQRVGRRDPVADLRLQRWLRARGFGAEADRISAA
jgi:hypothetical protein